MAAVSMLVQRREARRRRLHSDARSRLQVTSKRCAYCAAAKLSCNRGLRCHGISLRGSVAAVTHRPWGYCPSAGGCAWRWKALAFRCRFRQRNRQGRHDSYHSHPRAHSTRDPFAHARGALFACLPPPTADSMRAPYRTTLDPTVTGNWRLLRLLLRRLLWLYCDGRSRPTPSSQRLPSRIRKR